MKRYSISQFFGMVSNIMPTVNRDAPSRLVGVRFDDANGYTSEFEMNDTDGDGVSLAPLLNDDGYSRDSVVFDQTGLMGGPRLDISLGNFHYNLVDHVYRDSITRVHSGDYQANSAFGMVEGVGFPTWGCMAGFDFLAATTVERQLVHAGEWDLNGAFSRNQSPSYGEWAGIDGAVQDHRISAVAVWSVLTSVGFMPVDLEWSSNLVINDGDNIEWNRNNGSTVGPLDDWVEAWFSLKEQTDANITYPNNFLGWEFGDSPTQDYLGTTTPYTSLYMPYKSGPLWIFSVHPLGGVYHKGRLYTLVNAVDDVNSETFSRYSAPAILDEDYDGQPAQAEGELLLRSGDKYMLYSDTVRRHQYNLGNYFLFPGDGDPTGYMSVAAGLLMFTENETYLLQGDPDLTSARIDKVAGTVGCDPGVKPQKLGGTVYTISQGRVYGLSLGFGDVDFGEGVEEISLGVAEVGSPFTWLAVDTTRRLVFASRQTSTSPNREEWLVYDIQRKRWAVALEEKNDRSYWVPAPDKWGARWIEEELGVFTTYHRPRYNYGSAAMQDMKIEWSDLSLGDYSTVKTFRRVIMHSDDTDEIDRIDLTYSTNDDVSGVVQGVLKERGVFVFAFPADTVGNTLNLSFVVTFTDTTDSDRITIKPPLHIDYVPRYRSRWT